MIANQRGTAVVFIVTTGESLEECIRVDVVLLNPRFGELQVSPIVKRSANAPKCGILIRHHASLHFPDISLS
jgi:hypothetical protein